MRWNYKILSGLPSEHKLQELGAAGWELVCATQFGDGVSFFYFKRSPMTTPKLNENEQLHDLILRRLVKPDDEN